MFLRAPYHLRLELAAVFLQPIYNGVLIPPAQLFYPRVQTGFWPPNEFVIYECKKRSLQIIYERSTTAANKIVSKRKQGRQLVKLRKNCLFGAGTVNSLRLDLKSWITGMQLR